MAALARKYFIFSVLVLSLAVVIGQPLYANDQILFFEDWEGGVSYDRWWFMGGTMPLGVEKEGRNGGVAFDVAGQSGKLNGVFSRQAFDLAQRPELSFWLLNQSTRETHQSIHVNWMAQQQKQGDGEIKTDKPLISFAVLPENSQELFKFCVQGECATEPWIDSRDHDRWQHYKIAINQDNTVSFVRNGRKVYQSKQPINPHGQSRYGIEIFGRSEQAIQKIDDLVVRLPEAQEAGSEWVVWQDLKEIKASGPSPFYTRGGEWFREQLEFEFMLAETADHYAPAYFYRAASNNNSPLRVWLQKGELKFASGRYDRLFEQVSVAYDFQPGIVYRCLVKPQEKTLELMQGGDLLVALLKPPENLEAQILSDPDRFQIIWLSPDSAHFSHVKVYRATGKNDQGQLVADNITGMTFVDQDFDPSETYYYRLYSVDRNGNESKEAALFTQFRTSNVTRYASFSKLPRLTNGKTVFVASNTTFALAEALPEAIKKQIFDRWDVFKMVPSANGWRKATSHTLGAGYTLRRRTLRFDLPEGQTVEKSYEVSLERGWNVLGNPFISPVNFQVMRFDVNDKSYSFWEAIEKGWIADHVYARNDGKWFASPVNEGLILPAWRGIYLLVARDMILHIPSDH